MAPIDAETSHAIEQLVHEHAWLIDHGQAGAVPDLYTDDALLLGIGEEKAGRAAIAAWAEARQAMTERQSRHMQTNLRLARRGDGRIEGTVLLTLYRHDGPGPAAPAPLLVGEYADVYAKGADDKWRFAERRLTTLFTHTEHP